MSILYVDTSVHCLESWSIKESIEKFSCEAYIGFMGSKKD